MSVAFASLSVGLFGAVPTRFGDLWVSNAIGAMVGCVAAVVSLFSMGWSYPRVAAMAAPFFARGALYLATPNALPKHNEWAASTSNLLIGVGIILLEAIWTDVD